MKIDKKIECKIYCPESPTDTYVGVCEDLEISLAGDGGFLDCVSLMCEGIDLLFKDLEADGELEEFLFDHGLTLVDDGRDKIDVIVDFKYTTEPLV